MTIDDQLRDLARRADQHQQVITAEEIVQRASSHTTGSFATDSPFIDQRRVLNQMPVSFTEEDATMIDLEAPSQIGEHRKGPRRVLVAGLLAAAAVVAIALVAIRKDDSVSPADQPSTTVTVLPTTPPQALFGTPDEQLAPGTYYVDVFDGASTPRVLVTVGAGWSSDGSWSIGKGEGQLITFSRPDRVFLDACHPGDGYHPGPLTTLDGLVTALSEQGGWVDVTTPSDISIDGYAGKAFQRKTPADFSACTTGGFYPDFPSWENGSGVSLGWSFYGPGDSESVLVLDLDGTIVIVETRVNAGQPAEAHAELAALLDSIRIERA
jgi:hypothetical protein